MKTVMSLLSAQCLHVSQGVASLFSVPSRAPAVPRPVSIAPLDGCADSFAGVPGLAEQANLPGFSPRH